ncbi:MAG: hypothetical protein ABSH41_17350 [Syntrophobacteraceae bacterium]|jgi:hypothetical protein
MDLKRCLMAMFTFCFALVSWCLAKAGGFNIMAEVKAMMEPHNKAFNAQDFKGVMTTHASHAKTVLMCAGPS